MPQFSNPTSVPPPVGAFSHAAVASEGTVLHVSGQIGIDADGMIPEAVDAQCEIIWTNIVNILETHGMTMANVVKVNTYLLNPEDITAFNTVRSRYLSDHRPASTLVFVSGLVKSTLKAEVDVVAIDD